MTSGMVTNLLFVRAQTGKAGGLEEALRQLARETRKEPGSVVYEVHHSAAEREEYFVYGIFRSQADLDEHMEGAATQAFLGKVPELVNGALNLRLFTPVDIVRI